MTVQLAAEAADRKTGMTLAELCEFADRAREAGNDLGNVVRAQVTMKGRIMSLRLVPAQQR